MSLIRGQNVSGRIQARHGIDFTKVGAKLSAAEIKFRQSQLLSGQTGARLTHSASHLHHANRPVETKSANYTLDAQDCGKVIEVDTDAVVITLPSTAVGLFFTIVNSAADGVAKVSLDPAAGDKIMGNDLTAADNKDLINTKATAKKGDFVTLFGDGSLGWYIVDIGGTWAREA
jgi:hypothetical protein